MLRHIIRVLLEDGAGRPSWHRERLETLDRALMGFQALYDNAIQRRSWMCAHLQSLTRGHTLHGLRAAGREGGFDD